MDGFTSARPTAPVKPATTQKAAGVATASGSSSSTSPKVEKTPESLLLHPEELDDDEALAGLDAEFSKQLASGMEELMKEMNNNPELQKSFEEMFKGLDVNKSPATEGATSSSSAGAPGSKAGGAGSFQDRIAKTMDKLKDSSEQVDVSSGSCFRVCNGAVVGSERAVRVVKIRGHGFDSGGVGLFGYDSRVSLAADSYRPPFRFGLTVCWIVPPANLQTRSGIRNELLTDNVLFYNPH